MTIIDVDECELILARESYMAGEELVIEHFAMSQGIDLITSIKLVTGKSVFTQYRAYARLRKESDRQKVVERTASMTGLSEYIIGQMFSVQRREDRERGVW